MLQSASKTQWGSKDRKRNERIQPAPSLHFWARIELNNLTSRRRKGPNGWRQSQTDHTRNWGQPRNSKSIVFRIDAPLWLPRRNSRFHGSSWRVRFVCQSAFQFGNHFKGPQRIDRSIHRVASLFLLLLLPSRSINFRRSRVSEETKNERRSEDKNCYFKRHFTRPKARAWQRDVLRAEDVGPDFCWALLIIEKNLHEFISYLSRLRPTV